MASTITVQMLINYARTHNALLPLVNIGALSANEPALQIANDVKEKIISRPYAWKWNRQTESIDTADGTQDYPLMPPLTDINGGWLENAYCELTESTETPKQPSYPVQVVQDLRYTHIKGGPPEQLSVHLVGENWSTLRIYPRAGEQQWTIHYDYQPAATKLTALSDTFEPIPDTMSRILFQLFYAYALRYADDKRYQREEAKAEAMMAEILAVSDAEQEGIVFIPESLFRG